MVRFKPPNYIERKYSTLINKLLEPIIKEALKAYKTGGINQFKKVLKNSSKSPTYKKQSNKIVKMISTMLFQNNARSWRAAARKSSRGKYIRENIEKEIQGNVKKRMQELFKYNATLINTLPLNISEDVIRHINIEAFKDKRAEEIEKEIVKFFPAHSRANAKLIARTETSKFSSALTQARAEDLNIEWYIWRTSEDKAVRNSHKTMDDVLINYKHPPIPEKLDKELKLNKYPAPYHAGNIYNCRCYQEPLTDWNDIDYPHKVYDWKSDSIKIMTLEQIKRLS